MLVLGRRCGESIVLGEGIEITVVGLDRNSVKLGFHAPGVTVLRKEIATGKSNDPRGGSREPASTAPVVA